MRFKIEKSRVLAEQVLFQGAMRQMMFMLISSGIGNITNFKKLKGTEKQAAWSGVALNFV